MPNARSCSTKPPTISPNFDAQAREQYSPANPTERLLVDTDTLLRRTARLICCPIPS
jgi:hypothetical protein